MAARSPKSRWAPPPSARPSISAAVSRSPSFGWRLLRGIGLVPAAAKYRQPRILRKRGIGGGAPAHPEDAARALHGPRVPAGLAQADLDSPHLWGAGRRSLTEGLRVERIYQPLKVVRDPVFLRKLLDLLRIFGVLVPPASGHFDCQLPHRGHDLEGSLEILGVGIAEHARFEHRRHRPIP